MVKTSTKSTPYTSRKKNKRIKSKRFFLYFKGKTITTVRIPYRTYNRAVFCFEIVTQFCFINTVTKKIFRWKQRKHQIKETYESFFLFSKEQQYVLTITNNNSHRQLHTEKVDKKFNCSAGAYIDTIERLANITNFNVLQSVDIHKIKSCNDCSNFSSYRVYQI